MKEYEFMFTDSHIVNATDYRMITYIDAISTLEMTNFLLKNTERILNENDIVVEGTTSDALKTIFGNDMKQAKSKLKNIKKLIKDGKKNEAKKELLSVKKTFEEAHKKVSSLKPGPISFFSGAIVSMIISPFVFFTNMSEMDNDVKALVGSKAVFSALINILTITGFKMPIALAISLGLLSAGNNLHTLYSNVKSNTTKLNVAYKTMRAGAFNDLQRDVLFILQLYIKSCDIMLSKL